MESNIINSVKDGMSIAPKLLPIGFHYLNPQRNQWNTFIRKNCKNWHSSTPAIQNLILYGDTCDDGRNLEDAQLALRNVATVVGHNFRRVWAWAAQSTLRVHVAPAIHLSNCKYKIKMLLRNLVEMSQDRSQDFSSILTKMSEIIVLVLMWVLVSVGLGGAQGASSFAVATWICSSTKCFHPSRRMYVHLLCPTRLASLCLLALSVGQRLYINFSISRANFLTTLRSHLDVTCSCYFGPVYLCGC